ncbi:MAG: hypothetical protein U0736_11620 [Gemmataceae bacterium]
MDWVLEVRPIRLFGFYLAVMFVCGTMLRVRQYHAVLSLLARLHARWPNLTRLVLAHRHILVNRATLLPLLLMLGLLLLNTLASRLIWPQADRFQIGDLGPIWPAIPVVVVAELGMVGLDVYSMLRVGAVDQALLEKYFDQAEFWLQGVKAPVVRVLSLGFINPRKIVATEVRSALEKAGGLLHNTAWWVSMQTTVRIVFGLTLWGSYALQSALRHLVTG